MTVPLHELARIDVRAAAARLAGVVRETALLPFAVADERLEVRLKLECQQETNSFKARGLSAADTGSAVVTSIPML
jgi:threonine dehydratase